LDADKVPRAFVEPYHSGHAQASNEGSPIVHNYEDRKRVGTNHKPDTDLPEIKSIHDAAIAHAALRIDCQKSFEKRQLPAYKLQLQTECETDTDTLTPASMPPNIVVSEPFQTVGKIKELARTHISAGLIYTDELEDWEVPTYMQYIEQNTEKSLEEVHRLPEGVPGTFEELSTSNDQKDLSSDYSSTVATSKKTISEERTDNKAEIYLVLGRDSDEQKVAKLMQCERRAISKGLDLSSDTADEIVWEELKHHLESLVDE